MELARRSLAPSAVPISARLRTRATRTEPGRRCAAPGPVATRPIPVKTGLSLVKTPLSPVTTRLSPVIRVLHPHEQSPTPSRRLRRGPAARPGRRARAPQHHPLPRGRHGVAGDVRPLLAGGDAPEPPLPHAEHGAAGAARREVHRSLRLRSVVPLALQPDDRHERRAPQGDKLDA